MKAPMVAMGVGTLLGLGVVVTMVSPVAAASLRLETSVTDDLIKVGDLFAGADRVADRVVARAPAPGGSLTIDSRFLQRIAGAYRIDWQPLDWQDQVVVTRASQVIDAQAIRTALVRALEPQIPAGRIDLDLDDERTVYHLPSGGTAASVAVESVSYAGYQNRFTATVVLSGGGNQQRVRVGGRAVGMMQVPVLNRWIKPGEIITAADITWTETAYSPNQGDVVADAKELVGKTPRRSLALNRPVSGHDVQSPRLVGKGSLVTLVLRSARMQLTAQGKALQEGGRDEVIQVVNTASNRTIEGVVTGPGRVEIVPTTMLTN